jgi:UDPglucose 6-dehydrogenase
MKITVVGCGYVGVTTGVCLATVGHRVNCVDSLADRVTRLAAGRIPFHEPGVQEALQTALGKGVLRATTDLEASVADSEVTFICVGTPSLDHGIDLSQVMTAAERVGEALRRCPTYHVVAVRSTVIPGATDGVVRQTLEASSGRRTGEFGLCMNPEFLREGSAMDDFMSPDRIVIGQCDAKAGQALDAVYRRFDSPRIFTTLANAEMIKYASNALLATLISYSNEIASVCEATPDADVDTVLHGVHMDRRLSPLVDGRRIEPGVLAFLRAGCGFGGSCLPKDVNALRSYARAQGVAPQLLDAVMTINAERPAHLERLIEQALGTLVGADVAVLGLAFKAGTDDLRDSPAVAIIRRLLQKGAKVRGYDPMLTTNGRRPAIDEQVCLFATPADALRGADAAVVATAWPEFERWDWASLCETMRRPVIIDGRNALRRITWPPRAQYLSIGCAAGSAREAKP